MKRKILSLLLCCFLMAGLAPVMEPMALAYLTGDDYPYKNIEYGTRTSDRWGFFCKECTSFVAWCLENRNGITIDRWGAANQWKETAESKGYPVDQTPAIGAVAWWDYGTWGHVAWVSAVNGDTITIEEYNYRGSSNGNKGQFGTRTISKSNPSYYIHVKDIVAPPTASVKLPAPATPKSITGTWKSTGPQWTAEISWDKSEGATYYNVQYRTPKTNNQWKNDPDYSSGNNYISTGLKDYSYYEYRVQACNAGGVSGWRYYTLEKPGIVAPPAKPENVSASWTLNGLIGKICPRVSWSVVSGAEHYEVQYKKAAASSWGTSITVKSQISHIFSELDIDTAYDFRVKAVNAGGSSVWSECKLPSLITIKETVDLPSTIAAPTGVSAKWNSAGSHTSAELTWNTVSDVDYYEVGYKKDGGSWETMPFCIIHPNKSCVFDNLDNGSSYSLRVRAVKSGVSSAWAECPLAKSDAATELASPSGVSGVWESTGPEWRAKISWNAVSGATSYEVQYRTPKTGNAWRIDPDYISGTSYISTGLKDYNSYDYRVRAVNASGTSGWTKYTLVKAVSMSETESAQTTPAPVITEPIPPSAPSGVSGSWTSTGPEWRARISWNAVSGAISYEVQYRTPKTGNAWRADPDYSSGIFYTSTGLKDYNSYDYRVRAVNASGASGWTEYTLVKAVPMSETEPIQTTPAPVITEPIPPSAPGGVSGFWTSTGPKWQARISWNAVSGATYYEVQYRTPKTGNDWRADADYSSGTSYISTGLGDYSSYDYRVRACNSAGASAWTTYTLVKAAPAAPVATPPTAPTNVSGNWTSRGSTWQARISWAAVSGATSYEVQYRTPKTGNAWRFDPDYSSGTSYVSTGLMDYNSYDYRIRAVNASGASDWTEYTLYK